MLFFANFICALVLALQISDFVAQLQETLQSHYSWGTSVMIAITAAMLAASLISFLLHRN
jgi:hypothetical protein